ncbi:type VII secretion AAA-ATPase EccA [Mycobacteroides abscessus]|uniref:type VII secretion AAA-ATPase EccA n=1 Tax=Mycobacteroides abscessus TaxID=36809 RepID=UPI0021064BAC|nr:type VII secretion AAA-ATPase EccA [Mycobacteroides abscessus]
MTDMSQLYASAAEVGDKSIALARFTEITTYDEAACDAWVGRISCGDVDRITLFRAWFARRNFGRLASAADLEVISLNARVPIGGGFADLEAPVRSAQELSVAYALAEAVEHNFEESMEALAEVGDTEMGAWASACVHAHASRWDSVIDILKSRAWGQSAQNKIYADCAGLLRGVAAAHLGSWPEAEERIRKAATGTTTSEVPSDSTFQAAVGRSAAWYLAMVYRHTGREEDAQNLLRWLESNYPSAEVAAALKDANYRLPVTSREHIAARTDPWNVDSAPDLAAAEAAENADKTAQILAEGIAEIDAMIGIDDQKEEVARIHATTRANKARALLNLPIPIATHNVLLLGPPGVGKTTFARGFAKQLVGKEVLRRPDVYETSKTKLLGRHMGDAEKNTEELLEKALGAAVLWDEIHNAYQESYGKGDPYGEAIINTFLLYMENHRDDLAVFGAGYPKATLKMLEVNQGLRRRFTSVINFYSYTPPQLMDITVHFGELDQDIVTPESVEVLRDPFVKFYNSLHKNSAGDVLREIDDLGNAGFVRNVVEKARAHRSMRVDDGQMAELLAGNITDSAAIEELRRRFRELTREDLAEGLSLAVADRHDDAAHPPIWEED